MFSLVFNMNLQWKIESRARERLPSSHSLNKDLINKMRTINQNLPGATPTCLSPPHLLYRVKFIHQRQEVWEALPDILIFFQIINVKIQSLLYEKSNLKYFQPQPFLAFLPAQILIPKNDNSTFGEFTTRRRDEQQQKYFFGTQSRYGSLRRMVMVKRTSIRDSARDTRKFFTSQLYHCPSPAHIENQKSLNAFFEIIFVVVADGERGRVGKGEAG